MAFQIGWKCINQMIDTRNVGLEAENLAFEYLIKNGLELVKRNYFSPFGELDLIMRDNTEIVFVEVRKRTNHHYSSPLESVTIHKQKKIIKTAMHFLQKQQWFDKVPCRFDIIGITDSDCEWIKNAFFADYF